MTALQTGKRFGIEVNFLTGRYVATSYNDRKQAEWPPHMARLFSAMVAVWAEDGQDPEERAALEWLERQDPPAIASSNAVSRRVVSHFVPVPDVSILGPSAYEKRVKAAWDIQNQLKQEMETSRGQDTARVIQLRKQLAKARDVKTMVSGVTGKPEVAESLFPERRGRQERFFPSVTPDKSKVTYVWDAAPPDKLSMVLDSLLGRVARLGHSSSLVSCRITDEPVAVNRLPGDVGDRARTIGKGQLAALVNLYSRHGGTKPRSLPYRSVRYRLVGIEKADVPVQYSTMHADWFVFEFTPNSRAFPSTRTVEVARVMRSAIMRYAPDPIPEGLSGHQLGGEPTTLPHAAFLPLPYVYYDHSDGRLLGIAVSLPTSLDGSSRQAVLQAIGIWEEKDNVLELRFKSGRIQMKRKLQSDTLQSLRDYIWSRPSSQWVTATPIALPRHPGSLRSSKAWADAESSVADACTHVGLPRPIRIDVSMSPFLVGSHHVGRFPPFEQTGKDGKIIRRQLVHAQVTFGCMVAGPLVLGAGRFMGLGLMRPINAGQSSGLTQ